jgi:hypothetical protein
VASLLLPRAFVKMVRLNLKTHNELQNKFQQLLQLRCSTLASLKMLMKDTDNDKSPYDLVMFAYALWMGERQQNFLIRHKLVKQFLQEDDAGQR